MDKNTENSKNVLVGHYFHAMTDKDSEYLPLNPTHVTWQGMVVGSPAPGWLLVQLFSWVMGEEIERKVVPIEDMKLWRFYESAEEMQANYDELKVQGRAH